MLALVPLGIACRDRGAEGPGLPVRVQYGVAPSFGLVVGGPAFQLGGVRIRVTEIPTGALVSDTAAAMTAGEDSLALRLTVALLRPTQQFLLEVAAADVAGDTLFRGVDTVTLRQNDAAPTPSEVLLQYAGPDTAATRLAIAPRDTVVTVGEPLMMYATAYRADGSVMPNVRVGWTSSDTNLVRVAADGAVLALGAGGPVWLHARTATGRVDSTRISATLRVGSVSVTPDSVTLQPTESVQLSAAVFDTAGKALPNRPIAWTSRDPKVATVSPAGMVTAVAPGSITIIGESDGALDSTRVTVAVLQATSIVVTPDTAMLVSLGDRVTYTASVLDASGKPLAGATVAWTLDTSTIATLDSVRATSVQVVAVANGRATVRATVQGVSGTASVDVQQRVASIVITPADVPLTVNTVMQLTAQAADGRGNAMPNVAFTWRTDAPQVATVGVADGVVTALGTGTARITASADGVISNTALVTVTP